MLSDAQIQRLLDIALAACRRGFVIQAREICTALLAIRPGFAPACIGLAFSHIVVDEFEEAEHLLRRDVLDRDPGDRDALLMLGLAQGLAGKSREAQQVLEPIGTEDTPGSRLAAALLARFR